MGVFLGQSAVVAVSLPVAELVGLTVDSGSVVLLVGSSAASEVWIAAQGFELWIAVEAAACLEAEAGMVPEHWHQQAWSTWTTVCRIETCLAVPADSACQSVAGPLLQLQLGLGPEIEPEC